MFRSSFDRNLENATSHLRLEPDWPAILLLCDEINQKDISAKNAFASIKKKMNSPNPHTAYYALLVLESVVKNCSTPIHEEVFTRENCELFASFLEQTPHENVRQKMLELVQTWAFAFRSTDKYQSVKDTLTILKAKGHKFPELKESDAMFAADTAPNWADGRVCHRCRVEFTFTNRKHHCRNCGQVFCGQCTSKQCPLPKYGIEKDVRVCDGCFIALHKPLGKTSSRTLDSDLPPEYINSSLAQQVQTPPRKSDQELKEEEELMLALALSQSEAEQKKPQAAPVTYSLPQRSPSPETPIAASNDFQSEEVNPDLAKYLNRNYWEQRKVSDSPMASPSAPSPMPPTPQLSQTAEEPDIGNEAEIDQFTANMRTSIELFVNRMKSNSSRGRSISNDSSVQSLFLNLTTLHSQQLAYIKAMDDKRMWYEQLQDKLAQIKDSRAALDVLRQEHVEKLRRQAEEQERTRQIQMAQKLEIMRKQKQEYLQYQRHLALQRIQEQELEMKLRQEQQKAQYLMGQGQTQFPFLPSGATTTSAAPIQVNPTAQVNPAQTQYGGIYQQQLTNNATILPGMFNPITNQPHQHLGMPQQANVMSVPPNGHILRRPNDGLVLSVGAVQPIAQPMMQQMLHQGPLNQQIQQGPLPQAGQGLQTHQQQQNGNRNEPQPKLVQQQPSGLATQNQGMEHQQHQPTAHVTMQQQIQQPAAQVSFQQHGIMLQQGPQQQPQQQPQHQQQQIQAQQQPIHLQQQHPQPIHVQQQQPQTQLQAQHQGQALQQQQVSQQPHVAVQQQQVQPPQQQVQQQQQQVQPPQQQNMQQSVGPSVAIGSGAKSGLADLAEIQMQAVVNAPAPPQNEPRPAKPAASKEPETAELISFD